MKPTRRSALAMLAGFAVPLTGCSAPSVQARRDHDVIIIGGGLSGLHAAQILEGAGLHVLVLEASERIGGRLMTLDHLPGAPEAGGAQIGQTYARVRTAAFNAGLEFEGFAPSEFGQLLHVNGQTLPATEWPESAVNQLPQDLAQIPPNRLFFGLTARHQPLQDVYAWREAAAQIHDIAAEDFVRQLGADDEAVRLMNVSLNADQLSTYSMLNLWRSLAVYSTERGLGGSEKISGGNQRLPEAMAAGLTTPPRLSTRVVALTDKNTHVEVALETGAILRADFVVSAISFAVLRHLSLDLPVSAAQGQAISALPYTPIIQLHVEAETPFWQLDGQPLDMWTDTPLERVFAGRNPDGSHTGMATCWLDGLGAHVVEDLDFEALDAMVRAEFATIRPASEGRVRLREVIRWTADNPVSGGAYMHWAPGQIARWAEAMVRPAGRVHFAGEHTSHLHTGMEGAMEAGERAALEVLDRLSL